RQAVQPRPERLRPAPADWRDPRAPEPSDHAPRVRLPMTGGWSDVPVYFIRQTLKTKRQLLRKGDAWPWQSKSIIRGWSEAYGIPDDGRPFNTLPFVTVIIAPTPEIANTITSMTLEQAKAYLEEFTR